ncbi:hypothetical protein NX059_009822 [Plenodomus lindquistii]|nr:hypothetical protein NX059_009822 [Plenodomus lindquistii]
MRSFVVGALLLRTLNAQGIPDAPATLAPLLTPGPNAPSESQLSEAAAAAAAQLSTTPSANAGLSMGTADVGLPMGTADVILPGAYESAEVIMSVNPTESLASTVTPLAAVGTPLPEIMTPIIPGAAAASSLAAAPPGVLAAVVGARPMANFAGSQMARGGLAGVDEGNYDGQDYGDQWDDGQSEYAPDGTDYYEGGKKVACPTNCYCEIDKPGYKPTHGPPPPGYSPPPPNYPGPSPTPGYGGDDGGDYGGDDGGDYGDGDETDGNSARRSRKLRARQAASGGFAAFNWPAANDDSGASNDDDIPDWVYDTTGQKRPTPVCPKACCIKPSSKYTVNKPTAKYPVDPAPKYSGKPMRPTGYVPAPTGYVSPDEPWYGPSNYTSMASSDGPWSSTSMEWTPSSIMESPSWTTSITPGVSNTPGYGPTSDKDYTGDTLAGICPKTCNSDSDKNFCDITTSCTATGGGKNYCACRAGYMASAWNAKDFSKQFHVDGQPFVYVAPGVVCDKVCDDQVCKEVLTRPKCA